jgi:hypothetical protein
MPAEMFGVLVVVCLIEGDSIARQTRVFFLEGVGAVLETLVLGALRLSHRAPP